MYAFSDVSDSGQAPGTPNAIRVHPAHRSDIETQLSINIDAIQAALGISGSIVDNQVENELGSDTSIENIPPKEIDLVRARLAGLFVERYSVFRVRFEGTKPENRAVRLPISRTMPMIAVFSRFSSFSSMMRFCSCHLAIFSVFFRIAARIFANCGSMCSFPAGVRNSTGAPANMQS